MPDKTHIQTLRQMAIARLKKLPKHCTNILYATNIWLNEKAEYEKSAYFKSDSPWCIETDEDLFHIPHWYAQPLLVNNQPIQMIIDPHHIYVDNRSRCCTSGIPGMGIKSAAWLTVAQQEQQREKDDKTGLSLEFVAELRDRQRNAYAATTFSKKVEEAMKINGDVREANWCGLLRNWYAAVDDAGLRVSERIAKMLQIKSFLLNHYKPSTFPPPGMYVAGLPIAQFEGILSNIDRRLQLYSITDHRCFNQRAVSSLDSETMFGSFQAKHNVV